MSYTPDTKQLELMQKLLDKTFNSKDDEFLMGLLDAVQKDTATDYTKTHGFDFKEINWRIIKEMSKPGPHFDLRMAGGVYRFDNNDLGFYELLVDSSMRAVFVDGEPTEPVQVKEGLVIFSTKSQHKFELSFTCSQILGEEISIPSFAGHCTIAGVDSKISTTGRKFYPWGDVPDGTDDEIDHSPQGSKTVPEHKLTAVEDARDGAAINSLAVAIDFMSTKYTPPRDIVYLMAVDTGDLYLESIHFTATMLGIGLGAFLSLSGDAIGGALAGAAGVQVSRVIAAAVKTRYQTKQMRKMRDYIAVQPVDLRGWLKERVEMFVNEYSRDYLENSGMTDDVAGKVETEYKIEAGGQLRRLVRKKFSKFHHLFETDYNSTFDTAVAEKFKKEVSATYLKGLIEKQRDERLITKDLPREIRKLQKEQEKLDKQQRKELEDAGKLPIGKQNRKKEEIRKKYEADLKRTEKDLTDKSEREKELKEKDRGKDIDGRVEDLQKEAEARRRREAKAQRERRRGRIIRLH
ncbi:uncharacterized protein NFIA_003620 [Aspergillus fischeri NRRL 181]|uniref:Uncharacterized protein n=1 Tax=Neosartorya fischeri (strain ATCC 1020 / DSM 3700 / CBS 544.65 / FGSC A1164 / JCM 1740 / NRRL 181 / WB 181) TaxID=331117 RepID=A1DJW7_NEOFI|nr:uncharacterized protein NFIA_003620 [Aspergillus fischeri NRRL 181]EAW17006.1 hypothetical protein NFIA_003620 [Aspergillus fischeri NRRL 181]KAG2019145.1 hypothetical protein GB937_005438 [Aspergillus fischeri]